VSALNGFSGTVGFSISGLPAGATGTFNPTTLPGSGSSTLTVTTVTGTTLGNYPLTVTATSGSLSHAAGVTLTVTDFSVSATPATQSVAAGGVTSYTINTSALSGFSGSIGLSVAGLPGGATPAFNPATVSAGGSSTLTVTTVAGTAAASYPLTITAASGGLSHTANATLTVTAAGVGGFLSGTVATPPASVQLTTEGTADWVHWGTFTSSDFDHKAGVTPQISNFTSVAGATAARYTGNPTAYTWTDGTPNVAISNTATGVYVPGQGQGFRVSVPADTTPRTLRVYVGTWRTRAQMVAHLSDGTAPDYVDTSLTNPSGPVVLGVYTFTYQAASAGQTLTLTFTQIDLTGGNVNLQAATLR
jgi:hypothetical protein